MSLFVGLIASSIVGSIVFIVLFLLRPITSKVFSKTWHYYCLLVPLVFLIGGTHIAIILTDFMPLPAPVVMSQVPTSQDIPMGVPVDFIRPSAFDSTMVNTHDSGIGTSIATSPPIMDRLVIYINNALPFLLTIWVMGTTSFIAISIKKYLQYRRVLLQNAKSVNDLHCKIPIVVSVTAHTPMLIGVFKPMIVLPHTHFADDELNMILAHEMVHYKRKDLLVKLMMLIANALHWFNPAVYVLSRQLNAICELSCDEKVVSEMDTPNRVLYGETILQVLKRSTTNLASNVAFATSLCNSKKNFKRRLISMMNTKKMKKSVIALAIATGLLIACGGFLLSNMVSSVIPVYASEAANDNEPATAALSNAPNDSAPQQSTPQAETPTQTQESIESIPTNNQFQWPLDGYTSVTAPFGTVTNPVSGREEFHTGIDIPAPAGTPILAAKDGYVIFSDFQDGFGNMVIIYHGSGYSTVYAHALSNHVTEGQFVKQGEPIADVGATGVATGEHLHFEIRIENVPIDPLAFFGIESERQDALNDWYNRAADANLRNTAPQEQREHPIYIIEHPERNIRFAMAHVPLDDYPNLQPHHMFLDTAANIAADAIYKDFGFCIEGMNGHMIFVDNQYTGIQFWTGFINCDKYTTHSPVNSLFHFVIDAITGDVLELIMNTPDSPFH